MTMNLTNLVAMQGMLRQRLREATERTRQLMELWKRGQPAPELVQSVIEAGQELRDVLVSDGGCLPEDIRQEAIGLIECIEDAIRSGEDWLRNYGGPQLTEMIWRERLGKTYGLSSMAPNIPHSG
jgi:hypothetical protein